MPMRVLCMSDSCSCATVVDVVVSLTQLYVSVKTVVCKLNSVLKIVETLSRLTLVVISSSYQEWMTSILYLNRERSTQTGTVLIRKTVCVPCFQIH
jgi:hypothetical protein